MDAEVYIVKGTDPYRTAKILLKQMDFRLKGKKVFIKPNLTILAPSNSGVITNPRIVRAILENLEDCEVIIGDSAPHIFDIDGYPQLAEEFGIKLIDLTNTEKVLKKIPKPIRFKEIPFAKVVFECDYLINVAKLKIHALAQVTLSMKNLFGLVPTREDRLPIHSYIRKGIVDFMQVLRSDLNIIDGIIGNQRDEVIHNPVRSNILIGGYDALSVDIVGSQCMDVNPEEVEYIKLAQKIFGKRNIKIIGESIENVKKHYDRRPTIATNLRYLKERFLYQLIKLKHFYI